MVQFIRIVCVILLAIPFQQTTSEPITIATVSAIIGIVTGIITFVKQASDNVESGTRYLGENPEVDGPSYKRVWDSKHNSIMDQLRYLSRQNELLKIDIKDARDEIISQVTEHVPGLVELNRRLSKIFLNSKTISKSYNDFLIFFDQPEKYDKNQLADFAFKTVSEHRSGLNSLLEEIHTLLVMGDATTFSALRLLMVHMQQFLRNTKLMKSPHLLLYDLLKSVLYTEIKGYLTLRYSYRILDMYRKGNYIGHLEKVGDDFGRRINSTVDSFKATMASASREMLRNNPNKHIEDVTYTELKNVFQEFIINEYDISIDDSCKNTCSDYKSTQEKTFERCYYKSEICAYKSCEGHLFDCRYKIDTDMTVCPSRMGSTRRYEFIDYANGLRYGDPKEKCNMDTVVTTRHFSLFWWCDPCMCICAETSQRSERKFSLTPSMANIAENYVLTGVRFVKKNRMVYIQIQEGQLTPNGQINETTVRWVPFDENPFEHYTLQWDEGREINIDDLILPKNYVLTGLSFSSELSDSRNYIRRLHLKAFGAPIEFYSGTLNLKHQMNFINKTANEEIKLNNRDIPTRTSVETAENSKTNQYLKFVPTGLEKDVGQSTIPFLDIQEVITKPPVPMSGAGIYHKSRSDNGGFIAFKLFTYDYGQHLDADLPEGYNDLNSLTSV